MQTKTILSLGLKFVILTILYLIIFIAGAAILGAEADQQPAPEQQNAFMLALLLVATVHTGVMMTLILHSRWAGWKLMLAVGFAFYGVISFMAAIEAVYYGPALGLSPQAMPGLFLGNLPLVLIFVPLAVIILGKGRQTEDDDKPNDRLAMPFTTWVWKLLVIAIIYVVLYFSFGFLVAWQNPAVVEMYGGGTNQEIFALSRLLPFQMLRGVLWVLFALPVLRMTRGQTWQVALVMAILYASHSIVLVFPNPYLPDPRVRLTHLVEITLSNFILGWVVTGLMLWHPGRISQSAGAMAQSQTSTQ